MKTVENAPPDQTPHNKSRPRQDKSKTQPPDDPEVDSRKAHGPRQQKHEEGIVQNKRNHADRFDGDVGMGHPATRHVESRIK
ncbi:MAG: hypothetical protein J6Y19_06030, partial [Kiritimatiellae bacterium]|nr:hypothetical protein [Kiritimatiellia bacterium]